MCIFAVFGPKTIFWAKKSKFGPQKIFWPKIFLYFFFNPKKIKKRAKLKKWAQNSLGVMAQKLLIG